MEERNENLSYKPMIRYTNLPDESVPDDAENANIPLDNIDYLKHYTLKLTKEELNYIYVAILEQMKQDETILSKIDLVVKSIKSVNIFDSERWYNEMHAISSTGMTKENVDGIDYYKFSGSILINKPFMDGEFEENTQYTFKLKCRQYDKAGNTAMFIFNYTDKTIGYFNIPGVLEETEISYTTLKNKTLKNISLSYAYGGFVLGRDIMLYEGTDDKEYSPHQF